MTFQLSAAQNEVLDFANDARDLSMAIYEGISSTGFNGWISNPNLIFNNESGLYVQILTKNDNVMFVFKGTELSDFADIYNDLAMLRNDVPAQLQDFFNNVFYSDDIQTLIQGKNILFTGNSLGGSIAEAAATVVDNATAITFNSYGVASWVNEFRIEHGFEPILDSSEFNDRIINFISDQDFIGNAGEHIGQNIYLDQGNLLSDYLNSYGTNPTEIELKNLFKVSRLGILAQQNIKL